MVEYPVAVWVFEIDEVHIDSVNESSILTSVNIEASIMLVFTVLGRGLGSHPITTKDPIRVTVSSSLPSWSSSS